MKAPLRPGHEVRTFETASDVARAGRDEFVRAAKAAIEARGTFKVVVSGGSTPRLLYASLGVKDVEWGKVHVFFADERTVSPDRQESNLRMAEESFLLRVQVPPENVHRIEGEMMGAKEAAARHEDYLKRLFSADQGPPRWDLVVLGLGADGSTASLFPGCSVLQEQERWVAATAVEKLSRTRITMTLPMLNRAALVIFVVAGDEKAEAVRRSIEGAANGIEVPARQIEPAGGRVVWLLDKLAASRLTLKG